MGIEFAIREYLIDHGITQAFIARKCGLLKQRVNTILTKKEIKVKEMKSICEALDVPYDYFFSAAQSTA